MEEHERLIAIAERSRGVEGSEKWGNRLCQDSGIGIESLDYINEVNIRLGLLNEPPEFEILGPILPHNPLDPMNPAACLRRASKLSKEVRVWVNTMLIRTIGAIDAPLLCYIPTYADYMEALLNLHDLAKSEGGEWAKAWARSMTPEVEG